MPPRPSALLLWPAGTQRDILDTISTSAHLYPSEDVLTSLGPPLQQASLQLLKKQVDAETAAKTAVESLANP